MSLAAILAIIEGVLKFPDSIVAMVNLFKKTPQENHEALIQKINEQAKAFESTGRPEWK